MPLTAGDLIYDTGTISVTNGSTTVTGAGVLWSDFVDGLDTLDTSVGSAKVLSVNAGFDQITLLRPWPWATLAGSTYKLVKESPLRTEGVDVAENAREALRVLANSQIEALTPIDNDFIQRLAGAWTTRTPAQVLDALAVPLPSFHVGSFLRDTSSPTSVQAFDGVGFEPKAIIFFAVIAGTGKASWGKDTAAAGTHFSVYDSSGLSADTYQPLGTSSIRLLTDGSNFYDGSVATFDVDGFTISWTKNGTTTGVATIYYIAFR